MKNFLIGLLLLVEVFVFAQEHNTRYGADIVGLSSLVQLSVEPTEVVLSDYFTDSSDLKIEHVPDGLAILNQKGILTLTGKMKNPVDMLIIEKNGFNYAIPVRNTLQEKFDFEFKAPKEYKNLKIKGNFNGWDINKNKLNKQGNAYSFSTYLNPGRYEYVFVEEGKEFPDPTNASTISNGIGGTNSVFEVGDLNKKKPFIYTKEYKNGKIIVESKDKVNYTVLLDNQILDIKQAKKSRKKLSISLPNDLQNAGRCFLRVYAHNGKDATNDILIPLENGKPVLSTKDLTRKDKQTMVMYSILTDRFYDADKSNDKPLSIPEVLPLNDYKGGDFKGITKKIEDNFFTDLGVNTLWISPISQNPETAYGLFDKGGIKTKFSGYHGYWPISCDKIDYRYGTDADFTELINKAHGENMNVLLDYVANHVHEENPIIKEHPDWKTSNVTPDGRENMGLWDEFRLTTWFDPFLPTLDLENPVVTEVMTDYAVDWFKRFPIDGFRHDAVKHIPIEFWRTLTKKLKERVVVDNRSLYQIGETYGGHGLISSYVNNGLLDAQFEFNMYHHLTHSLINPDVSLTNLSNALEESLFYYGAHHVMGNITGNHDKARIISYADGSVKFDEDAKLAGYARNIENQGDKGFDIISQLMAFNIFIPGIPVIYYGDEIGMPGGNDPDCRRMMKFSNLNENQTKLRNKVKKLLEFRNNRLSLLYGDTKILKSTDEVLVVLRTYFGENTILVINKSEKSYTPDLGKEFKSMNVYNPDNDNSLTLKGKSFALFYN